MKSLDALIDYLLEKVALCGKQGWYFYHCSLFRGTILLLKCLRSLSSVTVINRHLFSQCYFSTNIREPQNLASNSSLTKLIRS